MLLHSDVADGNLLVIRAQSSSLDGLARGIVTTHIVSSLEVDDGKSGGANQSAVLLAGARVL